MKYRKKPVVIERLSCDIISRKPWNVNFAEK